MVRLVSLVVVTVEELVSLVVVTIETLVSLVVVTMEKLVSLRVRATQWVKTIGHCCKQQLQAEERRNVGQEAQSCGASANQASDCPDGHADSADVDFVSAKMQQAETRRLAHNCCERQLHAEERRSD